MLHTPSNRGTPISGENITKIVRQHYKPASAKPYKPELVQCRTDTACKKSKPDNYWTANYHRRLYNLDKGFYTAPTEPYRPIGGDLILDPFELVMSALPGNVEKKFQPRMTHRGTVYEPGTPVSMDKEEQMSEKESSCRSEDLIDTCPSAGFLNVKKLLKESRERLVHVRAGMAYEDHVKLIEERQKAEQEAKKPEDTDMVIHSLSSVCLPVQTKESRPPTANRRYSRSPSASGRGSRPPSRNSQCSSPTGSVRKRLLSYSQGEKHKLKVCARLDNSLVASGLSKAGQSFLRPGAKTTENKSFKKLALIQCNSGITQTLQRKERQFRDHYLYLKWIYNILTALHNMKVKDLRSKIPLSKEMTERLQKEGPCNREEERGSKGAYGPKFGKYTRMSTMDMDEDSGRMSVFGAVKRSNAMDSIGKSFFGRRRSKNAASLMGDRPAVETWEDLLNIQPQEMKEESNAFGFQAGIVTKFMRWYRRASVAPVHVGGNIPTIDKDALSHVQQAQEKTPAQEQPKAESNYGVTHTSLGSAQGHTEKAKKLPIWQQVAQEKSTVFHNKKSKAPNPDTTIQRFRRDLIKLKRSLQKENNAELEKLVRERVASFRLKFSTLNSEECSCLFEEQVHRIQDVKGNVNKSHLENFDVQPSKWYEELRDKTVSMVASFDQPEILVMITKLQTYAHMDNKTVPYAKAKLCLLMMSLPAFEICQIYVQKSLKFIFEHILLGQDAQFNEWLNHRKIPYMVVQDSQRPKSAATPEST